MRNKLVFSLVGLGLAGGFVSAYVYGQKSVPQPPVFTPPSNPFVSGVYAEGIVESYQEHGQNTNIFPEVTGVVVDVRVNEGQHVAKGDVLLALDDSVQRATTEQLAAQTLAAQAVLDELRAEPRRETLAVAKSQADLAAANEKTAKDALDKAQRAHDLDPRSVSKQELDNAINAFESARASHDVAKRQYELTKAGAWIYDIRNQERQVEALRKQTASAQALLDKYTLRAPRGGRVMTIGSAVGSYASPQGVYNPYTQGFDPIITMADETTLAVRCYVDEVLVPRLPDATKVAAHLFVRGTNISVPLQFVRVQPFVTPKIELSNARTEKVDLRVLPVLFRFAPPAETTLYPGQLVDVYIGAGVPPTTTLARPGQGRQR
ncbi:MAG TPA: biotin/lipoyl-binding protein [Kofleriaceae bacterium]|nr:biotin/lipoyl-binding protein [Kofleriaceae bacterium]